MDSAVEILVLDLWNQCRKMNLDSLGGFLMKVHLNCMSVLKWMFGIFAHGAPMSDIHK